MIRTVLLMTFIGGTSAYASPVEDLQPPRDPFEVERARQAIYVAWRWCRAEAYPHDPEVGVQKMSSLVTFNARQGETWAAAAIEYYTIDGTKLPPSPLQERFAKCVKQRIARRPVLAVHPSSKTVNQTWVLANPFPSRHVVDHGELGRVEAASYVAHELGQASIACGVPPDQQRIVATVDTRAHGGVEKVAIQGVKPAAQRCIEARLTQTLTFPPVTSPSHIVADAL